MATVLLVIHLLIAAALVGVVLLQRSEGGALGIGGGGGGGGGFMSGRGTANLLTRVTAGLAAAFFATSLILAMVSGKQADSGSVFGRTPAATETNSGKPEVPASAPGAGSTQSDGNKPRGGILDKLQGSRPPAAPQSQ